MAGMQTVCSFFIRTLPSVALPENNPSVKSAVTLRRRSSVEPGSRRCGDRLSSLQHSTVAGLTALCAWISHSCFCKSRSPRRFYKNNLVLSAWRRCTKLS